MKRIVLLLTLFCLTTGMSLSASSDGLGQSMNSNYWYAFNTITYDNPNL